jgi:xanthine dehydrogenase accessory factor
VVATQGQWDEKAILAAIAHSPDYLGVMASAKRFSEMRASLVDKAPDALLARIKNPAGVDLGATRPEEIALSILAEIVAERHAVATRFSRGFSGEPPSSPASLEARDPVCGMTVRVPGALHHARHQGREFTFCCGGCLEKFKAAPERYAPAPLERTP